MELFVLIANHKSQITLLLIHVLYKKNYNNESNDKLAVESGRWMGRRHMLPHNSEMPGEPKNYFVVTTSL